MRLIVAVIAAAAFTCFCIFFVDDFLWLDSHMHDVRRFSLESAIWSGTGRLMVFNLRGTLSNNRTYLLKAPCHLAFVRSVSVVSNWEMLAVVPILKCQGIMSECTRELDAMHK